MRFTVATYNIHKGFSQIARKMVIHELKDRLHGLAADVLFLQEVQGVHQRHARRYRNWPGKPQHEFIADTVWHEIAHHFGMDEGEVRRAERRRRRARPPHLNDDPDTSVPRQ